MYLVNLRFGWKLLLSVFFSIMLIVGWTITPAQAHCKGKHTGTHEHCIGSGEPPSPDFNPEIVWFHGFNASDRIIVIANGDGSNPTTILSEGRKTGVIGSVSWSPGGKEILLTRAAGEQDSAGVYRLPIFDDDDIFSVGTPMLVVESDVRQFTGGARWSPIPAPDDNYWIAYTDVGSGETKEVFLFDPATNTKIQLTKTGEVSNFTWSHDATRIAVITTPGNVENEDIKIYSLTADPPGNLIVEPGDPVSLLLGNDKILPGSNAQILKDVAIDPRWIQDLDWANISDRLIVNSDGGLMIVPVPEEKTQQAVADGTVLVIDDTEVGRIWPGWSPDDTALLYRRAGDGGTCSVPPKKGHPNGVPVNFVIGMFDNPGVANVSDGGTDDPDKIECDDETVLDSDGFQPEWWRGTFPQLPLPLPSL